MYRLAFGNARLFARDVFGRIGGQRRRPLLSLDIGKYGSHRGRLLQFPYFVRLHDTAATREIDIPITYSLLVTSDLATFFTETFRILATARIRNGRRGAT